MYFVCLIMQRTTVVLPARLKNLARARAHAAGISFGEFAGRALERAVAEGPTRRRTRRDRLLNVPKDFSARHNDYLYGDL